MDKRLAGGTLRKTAGRAYHDETVGSPPPGPDDPGIGFATPSLIQAAFTPKEQASWTAEDDLGKIGIQADAIVA